MTNIADRTQGIESAFSRIAIRADGAAPRPAPSSRGPIGRLGSLLWGLSLVALGSATSLTHATSAARAASTTTVAPTTTVASVATAGTVAEPASCRVVRLSDIGWTDVTATTGFASLVLRRLGYEPKVTVLSLPVTFASLRNRDIDVFLGNWMPSQKADRQPFLDDGSIEVVRANMTEARYTLAVPTYLYDQGLRDFADIAKFAGPLGRKMYGIEPGNDGNRMMIELIEAGRFGLSGFTLVESSEQGMLAQVERAYNAREAIVFFGWQPHPMNKRYDMRYLTGGDDTFGPDFGGAIIHTVVRKGYLQECPNVGRFLRNLSFTGAMENDLMDGILNRKLAPEAAAAEWLRANPQALAPLLEGVRRADGAAPGDLLGEIAGSGTAADRRAEGRMAAGAATLESFVAGHKIPVGRAIGDAIAHAQANWKPLFDLISRVVGGSVNGVHALLGALPSWLLVLAAGSLAWVLQRSLPLVAFVVAALLFIMNQGYWAATIETIALVAVATLAATLIGVPLGIAAAHRPRLYAALRPVLDLMQTLPTFVYLIPTLVLFGLGVVPGLISTVIFALPAPVRLTHLGITGVPRPMREAAEAFGATRWQRLWKIELPCAKPSILAGITQCIMLSLSMVVIAALVGAGGLGVPVVRALNSVQVDVGFEAGIAIVLLAIVLDRLSRPRERRGTP
jgi:glycine betaine/proline transport system substrate-binding protein